MPVENIDTMSVQNNNSPVKITVQPNNPKANVADGKSLFFGLSFFNTDAVLNTVVNLAN